MSRNAAGTIVVVGERDGCLPQELGKLGPAVIVEDQGLFPEEHLNMLVVRSTRDG